MLAITSINKHAKQNNLAIEEKLILACEFITNVDKDNDFDRWLREKDKQNNFHKERKK